MITLHGHENFRFRLILSTLSGKPIRITQIRSDDINPGLKDYEITFLRVLEQITNGSIIEVSYTGTSVIYKPGLIIGGTHTVNCPTTRSVGYFIEPLLLLLPFAKLKSNITFNGITASDLDINVDLIRTCLFPTLQKFGILDLELRITKRGSKPLGGGQAILSVPLLILQPKTLHLTEKISVNKIRGVAFSTRVSPTVVNRIVDKVRTELKPTKVDTFVYADITKGEESGLSPGFGVSLVAETKNGFPVGCQVTAETGAVPEDVGLECAKKLVYELSLGGAMGRLQLKLAVVLMALGSEDIGRLLLGDDQVEEIVLLLRDIAEVWPGTNAVFKGGVMLLKGTGFVNANKRMA